MTAAIPAEHETELLTWGLEKDTMNETNEVLQHLSRPLDTSRIATRDGAGGRKLSYLEAHDVISKLNEIFGFDGWRDTMRDFEPVGDKLFRATVDLEVRIGDTWIRHSDVGIGVVTGANVTSESIEKAVKEAVSDALKRAARKFGDQFGNCLYDKEYNRQNPPQSAQPQRPQQSQQRAPQSPQSAPERTQNAPGGNAPACEKCGGAMWDNRAKKAAGGISAKSPDFKCKDKENCDFVIWPPKPGAWGEEAHAAAFASTYD